MRMRDKLYERLEELRTKNRNEQPIKKGNMEILRFSCIQLFFPQKDQNVIVSIFV